jgi:hypothetical protein
MIFQSLIFILFYLFIIFSILGYGLTLLRLTGLKINTTNLGIIGLTGVYFLILISYFTHIFFPHNELHNSLIHLLGLFFLLFFIFRNRFLYKDLKKLLFLIIILLPLLFLSKNNEDFPYYHLPYALNLVENKIQFGIGNFNIAFRTPSSLFYLHSTFYLPYIKYHLFHSSGLIILIFVNFFLLEKINIKKYNNLKVFIYLLSLMSFLFLNTVFSEIAKFGTDRAGQAIVFILIIILFELINNTKDYFFEKIKISLILLSLIISMKGYFIEYSIFYLLLLYLIIKNNLFKKLVLDKKFISIFLFFYLLFFLINFSNSGCFVYPLSISCVKDTLWSVEYNSIIELNSWYELWSKSGAGPNFRVENPEVYLRGLNWVPGWFTRYFLVKALDTLAVIVLICLIVFFTFRKNINIKKNINYFSILTIISLLLLIWFFKHPDLRYGGYAPFSLICFIILCLFLHKKFSKNHKITILLVSLVIFYSVSKNIYRVYREFKRDDIYQYKDFPFFHVEKTNYEKTSLKDNIIIYINDKTPCWATPSPCVTYRMQAKKILGYEFFSYKKE